MNTMEAVEQKKPLRKPWLRPRHKLIRNIASVLIGAYVHLRYHITIEKVKDDRQYLIVMNHQTAADQFFVGMAFRQPVYYLASEDLFSAGFVSKLLRWAVAPIPIKKQTADPAAVKNCLRVAKEGGTIALAPEGNRTFDGRPVYIRPGIVRMMRHMRLPLAIFRIEGGYGVHPRWSDVIRKGKMRGYVSRVIEPEEYKALSDNELYDMICQELYVDEGCVTGEFHHKKTAEYLERMVYVCPHCGLSSFESHGDVIRCKSCGQGVRYLPTKELEPLEGSFPFRFTTQWYAHQCGFVRELDLTPYLDKPMYKERGSLYEVILYKNKRLIWKETELSLYGDRLELRAPGQEPMVLDFDSLNVVTVLGKNKLNIYTGGKVYQIKSDKRFNALKYVNIFYHYKNMKGEGEDGEFLGL